MTSAQQIVLALATLVASWLGMQAVHELGHVLGAKLTGGRVANVALHPFGISRTDLAANPHPLAVAWAGPAFGRRRHYWPGESPSRVAPHFAFLLRFFAGFCLLANGLYIGVGSFGRIGDCGELLKHGAAPWQLWAFGLIAAALGFFLWNGQGAHFGMGQSRAVGRVATMLAVIAAATLLAVGFWIGR